MGVGNRIIYMFFVMVLVIFLSISSSMHRLIAL